MDERSGPSTPLVIARGIGGAVVGAAAGYGLFDWLLTEHGFYAQAMPAAFTGLGCGWASGRRSWFLALFSLVLGTAVGLLCEHGMRSGPGGPGGQGDVSFLEFALQAGDLPGAVQLRLGVGAILALWLGLGRNRPPAE